MHAGRTGAAVPRRLRPVGPSVENRQLPGAGQEVWGHSSTTPGDGDSRTNSSGGPGGIITPGPSEQAHAGRSPARSHRTGSARAARGQANCQYLDCQRPSRRSTSGHSALCPIMGHSRVRATVDGPPGTWPRRCPFYRFRLQGRSPRKMKIVAVIPARFASTRLPGKPLLSETGRPLIQHVVEAAQQAQSLHRIIVATDDPRIAAAVAGFGGEAMMTRADHATGTDRVAEVAARIEQAGSSSTSRGTSRRSPADDRSPRDASRRRSRRPHGHTGDAHSRRGCLS